MRQSIDMSGATVGLLRVLERAPKPEGLSAEYTTQAFWKCRCECGRTVVKSLQSLRDGHLSCGHLGGWKVGRGGWQS